MPKLRHRNTILILLTVVYAFNFLDRQILGILAPFIQKDLGLDDGQLGLLAGFYFALFYTIVGLPIAWLADRTNRVTIIASALAIWSGFTAMCGLVNSYAQLAIARMGVGIGEAGGSPPSHSIISDLFPKEERGRALSIYSIGIPFGIMAAFFITALLIGRDNFDWRFVFLALGIPGIVLALIIKLVIPEPQRGAQDGQVNKVKQASFIEALKTLGRIPSYWAMCLGISSASFVAYGISAFLIVFLTRRFPEVSVPSLLIWLGVIHGVSYAGGTYLGGIIADRWGRSTPAGYAYTAMTGVAIAAPFLVGSLWFETLPLVLFCITGYLFFIGFYLGPSFSIAQTLAPVSMRAMSTAIYFFVLNLIALGGGPTFVGYLSKHLGKTYGEMSGLQYALTSLLAFTLLAAVLFLIAARYLPQDWLRAERNS